MRETLFSILFWIATLIAPFIAAWFTTIAIKVLKTKLGTERYNQLLLRVKTLIKAVEKKIGSGNGAEKKKEVMLLIANKMKWAKNFEVDEIIDAIVDEINKEEKYGK